MIFMNEKIWKSVYMCTAIIHHSLTPKNAIKNPKNMFSHKFHLHISPVYLQNALNAIPPNETVPIYSCS